MEGMELMDRAIVLGLVFVLGGFLVIQSWSVSGRWRFILTVIGGGVWVGGLLFSLGVPFEDLSLGLRLGLAVEILGAIAIYMAVGILVDAQQRELERMSRISVALSRPKGNS